MSFVKNLWYAAAWNVEVTKTMQTRRIIGEHILLYRKDDGSVVALSDTCPHRFAPLHKGVLENDIVECPYHGLKFNSTGRCVHNPHGDHIPDKAVITAYPIIERHRIVWIWMGDPDKADCADIPDYSILEQPDKYAYTSGVVMTMPVNYQLILDNLMDLTHAAYLHKSNLGSEAVSRGETKFKKTGNRISSYNMYRKGKPAPVFVALNAVDAEVDVDYRVDVHWTPPALMHFDAGITPIDQLKSEEKLLSSIQILTPETETSTHYLWCQFRNFSIEDNAMTEVIEKAVTEAFHTEDEPMIADVSARMEGRDLLDMQPVFLQKDGASNHVRGVLNRLYQSEQVE